MERSVLTMYTDTVNDRLEELTASATPDYDAIVAANEALGAARGKLDVANRKVHDRFAAVLTPEQREKIEQYRASLMESDAGETAEDAPAEGK